MQKLKVGDTVQVMAGAEASEQALRGHLRGKLPHFMWPSAIVRIESSQSTSPDPTLKAGT